MYILVNKTNETKPVDVVFYATEDLNYFDDNTIIINGANVFIERDTYEVHTVDRLPKYYQPNKFLYDAEKNAFLYVNEEVDFIQDMWNEVREYRNFLLQKSDMDSGSIWADKWGAKTEEERAKWAVYRQELRDITTNYTDIGSIVWPLDPIAQAAAAEAAAAEAAAAQPTSENPTEQPPQSTDSINSTPDLTNP